MEVVLVSTFRNISDIGTKALSQMRLKLLMFWCNMRSADGTRVGEQEAQQEEEKQRQSGKVMRLAKLLNKMILFGGLEQATADRIRVEEETLQHQTWKPDELWKRWLAVILFLMMLVLVGFIGLVKKEETSKPD